MTKVVIYTDFDGTITKRTGSGTVFTKFYQSLLIYDTTKPDQNYKTAGLLPPEQVQSAFEAIFGKYDENFDFSRKDADILMSPESVIFFHEVLKDKNIEVKIVTKNRADYIKALFRYQGFTPDEISNLSIMDTGAKDFEVSLDLMYKNIDNTTIYILDDDPNDYAAMAGAVKRKMGPASTSTTKIRPCHKKPGQFEWPIYLSEIKQLSKDTPSKTIPAEETSPAVDVLFWDLVGTTPLSDVSTDTTPLPDSLETTAPIAVNSNLDTTNNHELDQFLEDDELNELLYDDDDGVFPITIALVAMIIMLFVLSGFGLGFSAAIVLSIIVGCSSYLIYESLTIDKPASAENQDDLITFNQPMQGLGSSAPTTRPVSSIEHYASPFPPRSTSFANSQLSEKNTLDLK